MEEQAKEFFADFSKQDLLELLYLQRSALVDDVTLFLSLLFGFIAVAYFVGGKLSKLEKHFISVLYSLVMVTLIFAISDVSRALLLTSHVIAGVDTSSRFLPTVICSLGWLSSLWFMYRSKLNEGAT